MEMELKRGAINILSNLLQGNQWYGSPKAIYLAGQILAEVLPEPEDAPKDVKGVQISGITLRDWLRRTSKLTFTSSQAKVVTECVKFYIDRKDLPPGEHVNNLMDAFKLKPDDDEADAAKG